MTPFTSDLSKENMNVVVVGHVDHGKSTIIGRLLAETNSLPKGKLQDLKEKCRRANKPFEYAFLIDALKDEQAQSITIDSSRVFFQSERRNYLIIDAPGHIEFIKNMVTGASHAEAALLVIDALEGVQENSRRHGYLLWLLGIKKIIVLVNKMDLVGYKQNVFNSIVDEYQNYLSGIDLNALAYIPVSGLQGEGLINISKKMSWYEGKSVLEALDSFEKDIPAEDMALRLPVQDIYKFTDLGDNRRIIAGSLTSGQMKVGEEIVFYPSGKRTHVKSIETFNTPKITAVKTGDAVGFTMSEQIYVNRGQIITRVHQDAPYVSSRMRTSVFWLGKNPLSIEKTYILKLGTAREKVHVEMIHKVIDASDYANLNKRTRIGHHDVGEVTFKLAHPIAFDTSEKYPETSRFVIVDDYEICGGGIVLEALPDEDEILREEVYKRNEKWIQSYVGIVDRIEKYKQSPSLIIITGEKGAGRKTLARKLEQQLFQNGNLVYYLGVGSLLYGVNADIKRQDTAHRWREHVRRFSEVAHLFIDAGMILIITAIDLTQDDLDIFTTVIDKNLVNVIWVGETITTDIACDIHLKDRNSINEGLVRIQKLLQDRKILLDL